MARLCAVGERFGRRRARERGEREREGELGEEKGRAWRPIYKRGEGERRVGEEKKRRAAMNSIDGVVGFNREERGEE